MSKTIDTILNDMTERVKDNQPVSPEMWLDAGIKLVALKGDLDNMIAEFEAYLTIREAEYIKEGKPQTTAKTLAKADTDYVNYLKAKGKSKRIEEFIKLAKKRSTIKEFSI